MKLTKILALGLALSAFTAFAPAQTAPSGAVRAAFLQLKSDTKAALANSTVTPAEFNTLFQDLATALEGANKPSQASMTHLISTIRLARADGTISPAEKTAIQKTTLAVLASANIPVDEAQAVENDVLTIVKASGVTQAGAKTIAADLRNLFNALPDAPSRP